MPKPSERLAKLVSYGLGAILLLQFVRVVLRSNPLAHATIPAVPTLASTNAPDGRATNSAPTLDSAGKGPVAGREKKATTNASPSHAAEVQGTNSTGAGMSRSNAVAQRATTTNVAANGVVGETAKTNILAKTNAGPFSSNAVAQSAVPGGTNLTVALDAGKRGTNAPGKSRVAREGPAAFPGPFPRPGPGEPAPALPPEMQARVDRIVDSELFAPVVRPLPMALLGIAGEVAFLRAPNGQTGIVKENEELGGIKLLRIGTNRVLVEEEGQRKELTIFSGMGGESLLPKKDNL